MKGAIHIHTDYSSDGNCSIEQLIQKSKELRYDFLIITDHFEDVVDPRQQQKIIDDCNKLNNESNGPKVIPGIEVRFKDKAHILVIGIRNPIYQSDVQSIKSLRNCAKAQGALVGVAHLSYKFNLSVRELGFFDFIEGWNIRHDMKLPSHKHLRVAQGLPSCCILGGLDLHRINELGSLWVETEGNDVIEAIKQKKIITKTHLFALDSSGYIIGNKSAYFVLYLPYFCVKYFVNLLGQLILVTGWNPPETLKKLKRRII